MFRATESQRRIGLAVLRVVVGVVFFMHGWQKLMQMGHEGVTAFFTQLGAPLPSISAWVITILEIVGGPALILGFMTRLVGVALACDALGAIVLFHYGKGFFVPDGVELVLTLMGAALALAIGGPGAASVDEWIARRRGRQL